MNEQETNLIREYVHVHYLIKEAVNEIDALKSSRVFMGGLLSKATKMMGSRLKDKLKAIQKELRKTGVHVWIEDDGEEVIFVGTSKNGVKGRHGMKRSILNEDLSGALDKLMKEFMVAEIIMSEPYKVEVHRTDPYAKI